MFRTLINVFKVPELRNKILFTLLMLCIYRLGFSIPLPGVDQDKFADVQKNQSSDSAAGRLTSYLAVFSGGDLSHSTIFGLGVMPYISASIIFQLLGTVIPSLEKMQKEGEQGRRKIQEWTRYTTVPLAMLQGGFWLSYMKSHNLVQTPFNGWLSWWIMGIVVLTAGCVFLMWLGEQIDEYGLGNGISLLIMAGILSQLPQAIAIVASSFNPGGTTGIGVGGVLFLIISFVAVTAGAILITQAQRRITIQQGKFARGRQTFGGQKQFLPLRVNHGGVMPIIFAQSLMLFPGIVLGWLSQTMLSQSGGNPGVFTNFVTWLNTNFTHGQFMFVIFEVCLIYFFAYLWTTIQFQPKEMANQLQQYGSFIPGYRPGKRTADYLEYVMTRITFVGAAFLCIIAIVPTVIGSALGIDPRVASFVGGTGLLIVISVALDMVQRIEANLLMRNYGGFLGEGKSKRIRGRQN